MHTCRTEIGIELVYAEPKRAIVKTYRLNSPATIDDALRRAAADPAFAGIDLERAAVGVFGKLADRRHVLNDHDRVEIYRPLAADPKSARRARAQQVRRKNPEPK